MPDFLGKVRRALIAGLLLPASLLAGTPALAEDSYLLALTWQPGFCAERPAQAECRIAQTAEPRFTLHGLWPQWDINGDGRRDEDDDFCVAGDFNRRIIIGLDAGNWLELPPVVLSQSGRADLAQAMPGATAGLDRHEWWKHGSCSGLKPGEYFAKSIALLRALSASRFARLIVQSAGETIGRKQLLDAFEAEFGRGSARALTLDCSREDGATALQEIRIRLKRRGIGQGLTAENLATSGKAARGDCAAEILVPAFPH
jgi:ribonuclease T2